MAHRFGLGPVFTFEWLMTSRRWQVYAGRSLFVGGLLLALVAVWSGEVAGRELTSIASQARVGQLFFYAIAGTELALVLLAAPAAAAGAICVDKMRGTLAHVLVTDLSDTEIVLGKLAARLIPVVALVACALPVMALGTLLGGIDPVALTGSFLVTLGAGTFACALALMLSVWGKKATEVLLVTYAILVFWVLGGPGAFLVRWALGWGWSLPEWFTVSNPFWLAFAPYLRPGTEGIPEDLVFLAVMLVFSAALTAVAIWRLRPVAAHQAGRAESRRRFALANILTGWMRHLPGPSLDGNPVLWREWHRNRPSGWTRIVWGLYAAVSVAFAIGIMITACTSTTGRPGMGAASVLEGGVVALGLLLLSVTAPASLAEERARGSLDVLMATPLSTRAIVWGKWWGTYRIVPLMAIPPGLATAAIGLRSESLLGPLLEVAVILVYGAAFTSLGLALAVWMPRQNRAVTASVAAYLMVTVGWVFLAVMLTLRSNGMTGPGLASASPFLASIFPSIQMQMNNVNEWVECIAWMTFWLIVYVGIAVALYAATLASFDRCLGRMTNLSYERFRELSRKHAPIPAVALD